jgi:hypothetical protein
MLIENQLDRSNRVSNPDTEGTVRDLIVGDFVNWGAEARYLKRYLSMIIAVLF